MTTDTEKLAADIKRVMELDAKRPMLRFRRACSQGGTKSITFEWESPGELNEFLIGDVKSFIASASTMASIIRRQQEVIRGLDDALSIAQAAGYFRGHLGDMAESTIGEARRLAAPLVKKKGEL
jgi:hypothetical protein